MIKVKFYPGNVAAGVTAVSECVDRMMAQQAETIECVIRPLERRRSNPQNDFMWPLVRAIGRHAGEHRERVVLNRMLVECYGPTYVEVLGERVQAYPETSKFNREQMSDFLHFLLAYAAEHAVPTLAVRQQIEEYYA